MRTGYDSVNVKGIPLEANNPLDLVGGYVDGKWPSFESIKAAFPKAVHYSIAVRATSIADLLDIERGNDSASAAPAWITWMRHIGRFPGVYCSASTVPDVKHYCNLANVKYPLWFVANWDDDPTLPSDLTVIGKQYAHDIPHGGSSYDLSSVRDFWPGVDKHVDPPIPPVPPIPLLEDELSAMILEVDQATVPSGVTWPGEFFYCPESKDYFHVTATEHGTDNVKAFIQGGAKDGGKITYSQHLILMNGAAE